MTIGQKDTLKRGEIEMKTVKCIETGHGLKLEKGKLYEVEHEISDGFSVFYELKGVRGAKLKTRFVDVLEEVQK